MQRERVISFIDGFNLYHAIHRLNRPELKWINLTNLSKVFIKPTTEELIKVIHFSAYVHHISESVQKRQRAYIKALDMVGTRTILGHFKKKHRKCPNCQHTWIGHEEKETDVNIALFLLDSATQNEFDRAIVISNDSDLAPAIKMVRQRFPNKKITTIAPPNSFHSNELIKASSEKSKIRVQHLERNLLPELLTDPSKNISVTRPTEYMPKILSKVT